MGAALIPRLKVLTLTVEGWGESKDTTFKAVFLISGTIQFTLPSWNNKT